MDTLTATIFNIQPMSTEDGPGIRTTVFMKGCNMRCLWCQNPEGLAARVHLVHDTLRCIGCRTCLNGCERGAISDSGSGYKFNRGCALCLTCAANCPARAIRVIGQTVGVEELVQKLLRDKPFYDQSGGGVTFSGGECLLQHRFLTAIMPRLKGAGIHVCIDTAGHIDPPVFQAIAGQADLVLFDLKIMEDRLHRQYTGVSNALILQNAAWLGRAGIPCWIRVPVIPGYTDSEKNLRGIALFLKENMPSLARVDLLGYNDLCANDYAMLDRDYPLAGTPRVAESAMLHFQEIMAQSGAGMVSISNYQKGE